MAFEKNDFNTTYLPNFGNTYVTTLIERTAQTAEIAARKSAQGGQIESLLAQFAQGTLEKVNCAMITNLIASVDDQEIALELTKGTRSIMKHSRWNGEFAARMKNFKPYQKDTRLNYAHSLLEDAKARNTYPGCNALNLVLENCSDLEGAFTEIEELSKRGVQLNARTLDILINLAPDQKTATDLFDRYFEQTGINQYVMNSMIKHCDGVSEARDLIDKKFKGKGLALNHGSLLSLVACSKDDEEADKIVASLGKDLGVSNYTLNANLTQGGNLVDRIMIIDRYINDYQVQPNSTSFALVAQTALKDKKLVDAAHYIGKAEQIERQEQKRNGFVIYLRKQLNEAIESQQAPVEDV